jgi:hypothetical protein
MSNLNSNYQVQFSGTELESQQLHQAFRAHFPEYAKKLDEWDKLAKSWQEAVASVEHVAWEYAKGNGFASGGYSLNAVALANVNGIQPAAEPFNVEPRSDKTTALLYGKYEIALLSDPTAPQVSTMKGQFQNLIGSVGTWAEVKRAQTIRLQLEAVSKELLPEAARISMSHNLTVASKCPICPKS